MSCKVPEFLPSASLVETTTVPATANLKVRQPANRNFPHFPDSQFSTFLTMMSKSYYGELADELCQDDSFAEQRDNKKCWNGERIGEYSKPVSNNGLDSQKYNPEVKAATDDQLRPDSQIATLVDNLRHVRQMATNVVGPNYDDSMQRDGVDGSGSGDGPGIGDDDDTLPGGSGSGDGPIDSDPEKPKVNDDRVEPDKTLGDRKASNSWTSLPVTSLIVLCASLLVLRV